MDSHLPARLLVAVATVSLLAACTNAPGDVDHGPDTPGGASAPARSSPKPVFGDFYRDQSAATPSTKDDSTDPDDPTPTTGAQVAALPCLDWIDTDGDRQLEYAEMLLDDELTPFDMDVDEYAREVHDKCAKAQHDTLVGHLHPWRLAADESAPTPDFASMTGQQLQELLPTSAELERFDPNIPKGTQAVTNPLDGGFWTKNVARRELACAFLREDAGMYRYMVGFASDRSATTWFSDDSEGSTGSSGIYVALGVGGPMPVAERIALTREIIAKTNRTCLTGPNVSNIKEVYASDIPGVEGAIEIAAIYYPGKGPERMDEGMDASVALMPVGDAIIGVSHSYQATGDPSLDEATRIRFAPYLNWIYKKVRSGGQDALTPAD